MSYGYSKWSIYLSISGLQYYKEIDTIRCKATKTERHSHTIRKLFSRISFFKNNNSITSIICTFSIVLVIINFMTKLYMYLKRVLHFSIIVPFMYKYSK